ncbi:MAG TPA: hypothetical protein VGN42_07690 [Pirellulales bacterium]|nr:hypothetical protein [Pirellulales bacterium]
MSRSRWKIALATAALCILSPSLPTAFARPPRTSSVRRLQAEIKQLREEVAALRAQVDGLEQESRQLSFDRDGTIRNAAGRPVGYWGVDDPPWLSASPR